MKSSTDLMPLSSCGDTSGNVLGRQVHCGKTGGGGCMSSPSGW